MLHVALDDMASLITPSQIVICEGTPNSTTTNDTLAHDATCLDRIFSNEYPDTKFLGGGNCHDIISDKHALIGAIQALSQGASIIRVVDRDDRSTDEITNLTQNNIQVLSRRHFESYLFDDEVLEALCDYTGQADKKQAVIAAKNAALQNSVNRGNPYDDIKSASGEMYNEIKQILSLSGAGNNARAFMLSTLAPLITPNLRVYNELKGCIFPSNCSQSQVA